MKSYIFETGRRLGRNLMGFVILSVLLVSPYCAGSTAATGGSAGTGPDDNGDGGTGTQNPTLTIGDPVDIDGDGITDGLAADYDGDGVVDSIDIDEDGIPDQNLDGVTLPGGSIDIDNDGELDGTALDTDNNGVVDAVDLDDDGTADQDLDGTWLLGGSIDYDDDGELDGLSLDTNDDGEIDAVDTDNDGLPDIEIVDVTEPTWTGAIGTFSPLDDTTALGRIDEIVIEFNDTMDTASLSLGGSLAADAQATWSNGDTTLTLTPLTVWTSGAGTLTIGAQDDGGNPLDTIDENLTVLAGDIYYVSDSDGDNANDGLSPDSPKAEINNALDAAPADSLVFVATGTYNISTTITLDDEEHLFGGYATDFSERDLDSYPTSLINVSASSGSNTITASGSISLATVVDGFSITGNGTTGSGVYLTSGAGLTVQNCKIYSDSNTPNEGGAGIQALSSSEVVVKNSEIYAFYNAIGSSGGSTDTVIMNNYMEVHRPTSPVIFLYGSSATIVNNIIKAVGENTGVGQQTGEGIKTSANASLGNGPLIANNLILVDDNYGIYLQSGTEGTIVNNTIIMSIYGGAGTGIGQYSAFNGRAADKIYNNLVYSLTNTGTGFYNYDAGDATFDGPDYQNNLVYNTTYYMTSRVTNPSPALDYYSTLTDFETNYPGAAANNMNVNPQMDDPNNGLFGLTALSPVAVRSGGLNGAHSSQDWGISDDLDGNNRSPLDDSSTTGWSVGVYEYIE